MSEQSMVLTCVRCGEPCELVIHVESHGEPATYFEPGAGPVWQLLHGTCEACGHAHEDDEVTALHGERIAERLEGP